MPFQTVCHDAQSALKFPLTFEFDLFRRLCSNLVPRVSHLNAPGVKMRDPGNEVVFAQDLLTDLIQRNKSYDSCRGKT